MFNFTFQFINFNKKDYCVNQFAHVIFKDREKYKQQKHMFNPFKPLPSKEITYENHLELCQTVVKGILTKMLYKRNPHKNAVYK